MDIEALTKLSELKEKGLLTQEEFDKQKKALLDTKIDNKTSAETQKGINWKNLGISFLICLIYFLLVACIAGSYTDDEKAMKIIAQVFALIAGIIMAILSFSVKSGRYKNCSSPVVIFFVIALVGPLGIWAALYQFLQIKQGNVALKEIKKK